MPTEFKIPELGENVTAGDVVRVLVKAGDSIEKDQPVLELETDKATIEVPSSVSGTVQDVKVKQGDKVKVGQVVLTVGDGAAAAAKPAEKPSAAKSEAGQAEDAPKAPAAEPSKEAAADKAPKPQPQPAGAAEEGGLSQAATPERKKAGEGDQGKVRQKPRGEVVDINRGARGGQQQPAPPAEVETPRRPAAPAAPSVRRLARELGVDIAQVTGSGSEGRISIEDVQLYVKNALSNLQAGAGGGAVSPGGGNAASRFHEVGRGRAQADEQHPPQNRGASRSRLERHPARHPARSRGHHRG